ncbi:MAG: NAD(P)-dependent oxidoreductase [Dehalococcoidia bacterium]
MKVLITGAFGNLGTNATSALLEQGHQLRCFDVNTVANEKKAGRIVDKVEVLWGDIRNSSELVDAVKDTDVVIHLAFVLPPVTDEQAELAWDINVGGTQRLIEAMKKVSPNSKIIFSSSFTVFGNTQHLEPPRKVSDPVEATDNYTLHKIECEKLCAGSGLDWCVMRFSLVPPTSAASITSKMFAFPFETRTEFLDPRDAGTAMANAVSSKDIWGKILLIGGGKECQICYGDFISGQMEIIGLDALPKEAFGKDASYTDWLDTGESQRLLKYQQHTMEDWIKYRIAALGAKRGDIISQRETIRKAILDQSPYYKAFLEKQQKG